MISKEDLSTVYKEFKEIEEFIDKKRITTFHDKKEFDLFLTFYNQRQLNEYSKKLLWANFLLFVVTAIQLFNEWLGPDAVMELILALLSVGLIIVVCIFLYSIIFKDILRFLRRSILKNNE